MDLLNHVQYGRIEVEPQIMVGDGHGLESDRFGVFEESVGAPDVFEPGDGKQPVLSRHVLGKAEAVVLPTLGEEDVRRVRLCGRKGEGCGETR